MLEATDRAEDRLDGLHLRWVEITRETDANPGKLPLAERDLPDRDLDAVTGHAVTQAYRKLFWSLDVDPTKQRPAGEALARRVAAGDGLPRILPPVDAVNLTSAETLVPLSAFDLDALAGPLTLDLAEDGDRFQPIGEDGDVRVEPGRPVFRDRKSVVGLPLYRDGRRTALGEGSERAVVATAGPPEVGPRVLPEVFRVLESYLSVVGWRFASAPDATQL